MKIEYSFDRRRLIDNEDNVIALITKEGLLYLSPLTVNSNKEEIEKFIQDYKPIGFYDSKSVLIYRKYIESTL